jgi:hypothetical protein
MRCAQAPPTPSSKLRCTPRQPPPNAFYTIGMLRANVAIELREVRRKIMTKNNWIWRELYQTLDQSGYTALHQAHTNLDITVCSAYGMKPDEYPLRFLF